MQVMNLEPAPTQQKSFYGKALLIQEGKLTLLRSYESFVAQYDVETKKITINGFYSLTTTKHIRAFIYWLTGEILTKNEIEQKYCGKE